MIVADEIMKLCDAAYHLVREANLKEGPPTHIIIEVESIDDAARLLRNIKASVKPWEVMAASPIYDGRIRMMDCEVSITSREARDRALRGSLIELRQWAEKIGALLRV